MRLVVLIFLLIFVSLPAVKNKLRSAGEKSADKVIEMFKGSRKKRGL